MQTPSLVMAAYQQGLQRAVDVIANNVANSNTTGFKRQNLIFDTLVERPDIDENVSFAVDKGTFRTTAQGPLQMTGNPLDLAIQGQGYFQVQTPQGNRFTRAGVFLLNSAGEVVTPAGHKLLADGGQPIVLPNDAKNIQIAPDGVISAQVGNAAAVSQFGRIQPVKFAREQEMVAEGNSLYTTRETPLPDPDSRLAQGMVERSNVDTIKEMTQLITLSRSYQQISRLLEQDGQRRTDAINKLGRVTA